MGHAAPPLRLKMPWLATRRFRLRQTYAAATRRRGACSLRPLARLVCVCCRGPSPKLQLEWAQMACVAFFRMIEGCDPEQYAVLDLDIIGAARFQVPH